MASLVSRRLGRRTGVGDEMRVFGRAAMALLGTALVVGGGLGWHAAPARAQQVDRVAVVEQFLNARSTFDVDGAVATFADNAVYAGGRCPLAQPCVGTDAIRQELQRQASSGWTATLTDIEVRGSVVIGRFEYSGTFTQSAGLQRLVTVFMAQVPNDKITSYVGDNDLTDPQTAAFNSR